MFIIGILIQVSYTQISCTCVKMLGKKNTIFDIYGYENNIPDGLYELRETCK